MKRDPDPKPCFFSPGVLSIPEIPAALRKLGRSIVQSGGCRAFSAPLIAAFASELIEHRIELPEWSKGSSTRYLILIDVPEQVLPRVFSQLDLRRPDQRLHITRDQGAIRRLLVSTTRAEPMLGIVDAFIWMETLTLVTGDFRFRTLPVGRIPVVSRLPIEERHEFEIDADGSYLYWVSRDIHLGVSQILQDADPMYLADMAIERNRRDRTGAALRRMREEAGLRQSDIPGLSERQVRRIEDGISRLRVPTAERFAAAFRMTLGTLLDNLGRHASEIRKASSDPVARRGEVPY